MTDVRYERISSNLPSAPDRPSVTARYSSPGGYAPAAHEAAKVLVAERFLLAEEIDSFVAKAAAAY